MNEPLEQSKQSNSSTAEKALATYERILIVEDSQSEQARLTAMLVKLGYDVEVARNGKQALDILSRDRFGLIISDWRMPEMCGVDLCKAIRAEAKYGQPYFILLTGCDSPNDLIAGMDSGADDFITKPFVSEELRVRVQAGIRIIQLQHQLEQQNQRLNQLLNTSDA